MSPLLLPGQSVKDFWWGQRTGLPNEAFELGLVVLIEQLLLCLCLNKREIVEIYDKEGCVCVFLWVESVLDPFHIRKMRQVGAKLLKVSFKSLPLNLKLGGRYLSRKLSARSFL